MLLKKTFAIRAKYQPNYSQASVVKITCDHDVITMIENAIIDAKVCFVNTRNFMFM